MKLFDSHDTLLQEMYQDGYFPNFLVDKVKDALEQVIVLLETGETDTDVIQKKLDISINTINDLQEEFEQNDSEIETVARECIIQDVQHILEWFDIPIDAEDATGARDW